MLMMIAAFAPQQAAVQPSHIARLDVPAEFIMASPSGVEIFQLVVSPEGRVVACNVRILGRGPVQDDRNCSKLLKLTATPASDQDGRATYSTVELKTSWNMVGRRQLAAPPKVDEPDVYLPVRGLPPGLSIAPTSYLLLVTGIEGKVETCTVSRSSGHAGLDEAACRAVTASGAEPLKDGSGRAVRSVQNITVGFKLAP